MFSNGVSEALSRAGKRSVVRNAARPCGTIERYNPHPMSKMRSRRAKRRGRCDRRARSILFMIFFPCMARWIGKDVTMNVKKRT
jgi:hypothetical protein